MKTLSRLGEDVDIQIEETPSHRGNEAELTKAVIRYRANGVTLEKPVLLRECLLGDKGVHNAEIRDIYDRLRAINAAYSQEGKPYRINVVRHFTDDSGNIYVKDLNPGGEVYAHDLLPDPNYFDEGMKPKSRFGEFKRTLGELNLNRSEIIRSVFEQLAILHSNGFVVGTIVRGEREVTHPTLSLFICRLKNKRSEEGVKLFIHDIHNLVEFPETGNAAYVSHAVRDLRDLAFDIIRFFKGIGLPQ